MKIIRVNGNDKFLFIGDLHIDQYDFRTDKDKVVERKINLITELIELLGIEFVFFTGDIFNRLSVSKEYFCYVINLMMKNEKFYNVKKYSLIGNHDYRFNINNFETSIVSLLRLINFEFPDRLIINDEYIIDFYHYDKQIELREVEGYKNKIAMFHYFLNEESEEERSGYVNLKELLKTKYDVFIFGHSHHLEIKEYGGKKFIFLPIIIRKSIIYFEEGFVTGAMLYDKGELQFYEFELEKAIVSESKKKEIIDQKITKFFSIISECKNLKRENKYQEILRSLTDDEEVIKKCEYYINKII